MAHGVLVIHGFTATPECMDSLVQALRREGFSVEAPLLAGHGTSVQDLAKTTWQDWYQSVVGPFEKLQRENETVCVAGLSLGGLLTLLLAASYPVRKIALLATPVIFTSFLTTKVLPFVGNSFLGDLYPYPAKWAGPAIADPEAAAAFKSYTKMPMKGLMEIVRLQEVAKARLASVKAPTLIVHSPLDVTAPYANMAYLREHLGAKNIQTVSLQKSNHVLTVDYEKDLVAREVASFFRIGEARS